MLGYSSLVPYHSPWPLMGESAEWTNSPWADPGWNGWTGGIRESTQAPRSRIPRSRENQEEADETRAPTPVVSPVSSHQPNEAARSGLIRVETDEEQELPLIPGIFRPIGMQERDHTNESRSRPEALVGITQPRPRQTTPGDMNPPGLLAISTPQPARQPVRHHNVLIERLRRQREAEENAMRSSTSPPDLEDED